MISTCETATPVMFVLHRQGQVAASPAADSGANQSPQRDGHLLRISPCVAEASVQQHRPDDLLCVRILEEPERLRSLRCIQGTIFSCQRFTLQLPIDGSPFHRRGLLKAGLLPGMLSVPY